MGLQGLLQDTFTFFYGCGPWLLPQGIADSVRVQGAEEAIRE
jgi:hypothetical protein